MELQIWDFRFWVVLVWFGFGVCVCAHVRDSAQRGQKRISDAFTVNVSHSLWVLGTEPHSLQE